MTYHREKIRACHALNFALTQAMNRSKVFAAS
jgi:hypothetical protein